VKRKKLPNCATQKEKRKKFPNLFAHLVGLESNLGISKFKLMAKCELAFSMMVDCELAF